MSRRFCSQQLRRESEVESRNSKYENRKAEPGRSRRCVAARSGTRGDDDEWKVEMRKSKHEIRKGEGGASPPLHKRLRARQPEPASTPLAEAQRKPELRLARSAGAAAVIRRAGQAPPLHRRLRG